MCPPGKGEGTRACPGRGLRRQTRPGLPEGKSPPILFHPQGLSAGRADPFVPGGRLTAYRLALTVKGSGYGPGSRTPSPACSTPGATTPDVVPPTPPGPAPPRLPENRYILVQSTSKADGQVRPAGVVQMCPPESRMPDAAHLPWNMKPGGRDGLPSAGSPYHVGVKDAAENQRNGVVKKSVPVTVVSNIRPQGCRGEPQTRPSRPPGFIRSPEPARRVPSCR